MFVRSVEKTFPHAVSCLRSVALPVCTSVIDHQQRLSSGKVHFNPNLPYPVCLCRKNTDVSTQCVENVIYYKFIMTNDGKYLNHLLKSSKITV